MRRAGLVAAALAGAVAAAVLAAGALTGWWRGGGSAPRVPLVASATVAPGSALFGEQLTATVDVLADRARVDPRSVTVAVDFRPYRPVATPSVSRTSVGRATRVAFSYRLACLEDGCLPRAKGFSFRAARIRARTRDGRTISARAGFPTVAVASRLTKPEATATRPRYRGGANDLVPPRYAIDPDLAAGLLAGGCALLALLAGGAAVLALRALRRPAAAPAAAPAPSPRELALALARRAARSGPPAERRRALELLARVLGREGEPELARAAERLAWSPARPSPPRVEAFADEVAGEEARR